MAIKKCLNHTLELVVLHDEFVVILYHQCHVRAELLDLLLALIHALRDQRSRSIHTL